MATTVYTDGACIGNPGPGGWAWAVPGGAHASGAEADSTNNRMELRAVLEALRSVSGPVLVRSDSKYIVDGFKDRWYEAWERKGWKNSKREPVKNRDLWEQLIVEFRARGDDLDIEWVKGHGGDPMNDVVDRLAVEAATTQRGRSGATPPIGLGAADDPSARGAARGEAAAAAGSAAGVAKSAELAGHRLVVLGHRPPQLGGYDDNPLARDLRRRLVEVLTGLRSQHPDLVVLTGLGLGAEQLGAEAAAEAGVPYVAVLPFPDVDAVWGGESRRTFRSLLAGAAAVRTHDPRKPSSKQAAAMAIGRRDDWLVQQADGAVVVWDGDDRNLGELVARLERRIPDEVWLVPPVP